MTKERLNMSTENNENNNRQEPKRVRQLLLMLILSWIALISVTVQYVRYRQQVVQQTELIKKSLTKAATVSIADALSASNCSALSAISMAF